VVATSAFTLVAAAGGAFESPLAALAPFAALLCGLAFAGLLAFVCARVENDEWLASIYRFGLMPLFLFSGTFFPIDQLPQVLQPVAWLTPLWNGVALCRGLCTGEIEPLPAAGHVLYLVVLTVVRAYLAVRAYARTLQR
jgi:lipooligosaccharide transport system permease protein